MTLCGSTLYGETESGGASGDGTIFSIPVTGGTPATLFSFDGADGAIPTGFLTFSGPTLYGMTLGGGGGSLGTIFALMVFGPGDANGDGQVNVNDLTIVLSNFGQTGCSWAQGCMDGDPTGTVDVNDLTIVLSDFGRSFGSAAAAVAAVPEPSVAVLAVAGLAGLVVLAWRKRRSHRCVSRTYGPVIVQTDVTSAPLSLRESGCGRGRRRADSRRPGFGPLPNGRGSYFRFPQALWPSDNGEKKID